MSKKIILIIGVLVIIIGGIFVYRGFIKEEPLDFVLEKVFRGDVYQEVVETGIVRAGEEIDLSFKNMGRIEKMAVEVGDTVELGQILAKLDDTHLLIQLSGAKAALGLTEAGLNRLLAGASEEEIRITQTAVNVLEKTKADLEKSIAQRITQTEAQVSSVQISLQRAEQHLIDTKASVERELNQADEHGLNILDSVFLKADNTLNVVDSIQRAYFRANDQHSIRVRTHETAIERAKQETKFYLEIARNNPSRDNINTALLKARQNLETISDSLAIIREICDVPAYRHIVSDISRASLDAQRAHIATILTKVINVEQAIFSAQSIGQAKITTAEGQVASTESALRLAQESLAVVKSETAFQLTQTKGQLDTTRRQLELKQADPRQVDIALHQAKIKQARASKAFLQEQIQESMLRSPVAGKIVEVFKRRGEIISPMQPIAFLLPIAPFQVEVDIYEEDVVKIKVGNLAKIDLIAFPDQPLKGKVVSINPTETLIGGVVHFKTTIAFVGELPEGIRSGMTADIVIKPIFKEDVLIIDEDAIIQRDDRYFVEVFKDGEILEREIEIGLQGERDRVEVISGLKQGEQVIVR